MTLIRTVLIVAALVAPSAAIAAPAAHPAPPIVVTTPAVPSAMPVVRPSADEALAFVKLFSPTDLRREGELQALHKTFIPGLRKQPGMDAMLDAYPDLGNALMEATAGQIDIYMEEYDERFFPRATEIVRTSLSRDDVLKLTDFYGSPLGRKMLKLAAENADGSEVVEAIGTGGDVTSAMASRQSVKTGFAVMGDMSPDERAKFMAFAVSPVGRHLRTVRPQITAVQLEIMNNPGPRFSAAISTAMSEAFTRVTGAKASGK